MKNGRLPASALQSIPGGKLRKGASARSWLAMRYFIGRRNGVWIKPGGPRSSYRSFAAQEEFYRAYQNGSGALAARPGTSNHGWGLAVDDPSAQSQKAIVTVGHLFGWGIRGELDSDAPSERWHASFVLGAQGKMTAKARWWYARYRLALKKNK